MANLQVGVAGNGTVTVGAGASVHSPASNVLTLGTNGDERLRITSAGLVGMGVAAPAEALDVTGSIQASAGLKLATHPVVTYASFTDVSGGSYATRLGSTGSSTLRSTQIYAGGGHMATFDGVNTRLGIATAIPVTTLDVRGNMAVDYNATHALRFYTQPRNNWSSITNTATDGNANLSFKSSQGEAMFITYGRNIGIGTDNPGRKLEVWDASESNVRIEGGADYFEFRVKDSDNALTVHKNIAGGGSSEVLRIDSTGTTTFDPSAGGTLKIGGSSAHTSKIVIADNGGTGNGNCLVEGGDGTDFFTIQSNGNVAFENGKGINFGASAGGGASASILDDYEEGSFTGTWTAYTTAASTTATSTNYYTKIGRQVTCYINLSNATIAGGGGPIQMTGLPFATSSGLPGGATGTSPLLYKVDFDTDHIYTFYTWQSVSFFLGYRSRSGTTWTAWDVADFHGGNRYCQVTFTYFTDS